MQGNSELTIGGLGELIATGGEGGSGIGGGRMGSISEGARVEIEGDLDVSEEGKKFTITGATLYTKDYDGQTYQPTYSGLPSEGVTYSYHKKVDGNYTDSIDPPKNIGEYKLTTSIPKDSGEIRVIKKFEISPKELTLTGRAETKIYDGNTDAVVTFASEDIVDGDTVDIESAPASFADADVGTGKTVTASGITLSGTDASNYNLKNTELTLENAEISQRTPKLTLEIDLASPREGQTVILTAKVQGVGEEVLSGSIEFKIDGELLATVDLVDGLASHEWKNVQRGTYSLTVDYSQSNPHNPNYQPHVQAQIESYTVRNRYIPPAPGPGPTPTPDPKPVEIPEEEKPVVEIPADKDGGEDQDYKISVESGDEDKEITVNIPEDKKGKVLVDLPKDQALPQVEINKGKITASIPKGAKITSGDSSALELITTKDTKDEQTIEKIKESMPRDQGFDNIEHIISMGGKERVEFDTFITLRFKDSKGKEAAYIQDGKFHIIERYASEEEGRKSGKMEYAYYSGDDLIIKTRHFTDFMVYNTHSIWGKQLTTDKLDYSWTIRLNMEVDRDSVDRSSVYILDKDGEKLDFIDPEVTNDGEIGYIKLKNKGQFKAGATYYIIIGDTVRSIDGKELKKGLKVQFTVE